VNKAVKLKSNIQKRIREGDLAVALLLAESGRGRDFRDLRDEIKGLIAEGEEAAPAAEAAKGA